MRKLLVSLTAFLLFIGELLAQKSISGKVTDESGTPIPNASVVVKGSTVGTTTKQDGTYSLTVPAGFNSIIISGIGSEEQEISLATNETFFETRLKVVQKSLDEVLVVAYGTAKKRTFTGSASTIKSEDIGKMQISSFTRALEGAVPGVQVTSGSGQPGSGSAIRIRGVGSINASSNPLFVVDGIPFGGDFNSINTNDIESLSVLKDAASTALYGARGANGVILITTKKGKGKAKVELQTRWGTNSRAVEEYDVIKDPGQYLEVAWLSLKNEALNRNPPLSDAAAGAYASTALFGPSYLNGYKPYSVPAGQSIIDPVTGKLNSNAKLLYYDDWADAMFDNRSRQEHIATISGSSDKTSYFFSLGYLNDKGYMVKTNFDRLTTRLKIDHEVRKWFKTGINLGYAKTKQNNTEDGNTTYQNAFFFTRNIAPVYPVWVRDASGNFVLDAKGNRVYDFGDGAMGTRTFGGSENPRASLDLDIDTYEADNISNRTYLELSPIKDLTFTLNYGLDLTNYNSINYTNPTVGFGIAFQGASTLGSGRDITENINQLLNYKPSFGDHNFDLLLGHETYKLTLNSLGGSKQLFLFPNDPQLNGAVTVNNATSKRDKYTVEGYFGQLRYDFMNKYFISGSIRRDGSSRFAPGNKWGNFWSAGLGWNLMGEKFMNNIEFLDLLKLKFSVGEKGNDNLNYVSAILTGTNYYPYATQYIVQTSADPVPNLTLAYTGNVDITWEKNRDINYGVEFELFKRKVSGSFEFFKRTTTDLLFPRPLAFSTGIQSVPSNIGDMYNKGYEGELTVNVINKRDFSWSVSVNATHWENKLTKLPPENEKNGIVTGNNKLLPGHSIYEYFTWAYAGVDQSTGLSLFYKDEMGTDGKPTGKRLLTTVSSEATRYYTGKVSTPDVSGGVSTQVRYKGFDFSVLTSFAIGGWIYDAPYQSLMGGGDANFNAWHKDILQAWTPQNINTSVPKVQDSYQDADATSDRWLIKGDYFNLRNITLGYTINKGIVDRYGLANLRFYVLADNVWLNTRRQGLDPRQDFNGSVFNVYSPIRTISVGLNVTF